jgi:uncharacterized membrane protein
VSVNTRGDVLLNRALTATRSTFVLRRDGSASFCDETGNAMNDKGEVVGFARTLAASATVPFLCDSKKRTFMTLPCRSGPVQFGDGGSAGGINQFSEVVGSCSPDGEPTTAVVWDQGRNPTALPPLAGQNCGAIGINKRGVIVGGCRDVSSGMLTGVVWKWCGGDSRRCR